MQEYIPSQQNININISYNVEGSKLSKSYFGKKINKNTKIVPEKDKIDLNVKVPKKIEEINAKL